MANPLKAIDGAILATYQKIADYCELRTGLTCFELAKLFAVATSLPFYVAGMVDHLGRINVNVAYILLGVLFSGSGLGRANSAERAYRPGKRNVVELDFGGRMVHWVFFILLVPVPNNLPAICMCVFLLLQNCHIYFVACTPLPPGTRLKKEAKVAAEVEPAQV